MKENRIRDSVGLQTRDGGRLRTWGVVVGVNGEEPSSVGDIPNIKLPTILLLQVSLKLLKLLLYFRLTFM